MPQRTRPVDPRRRSAQASGGLPKASAGMQVCSRQCERDRDTERERERERESESEIKNYRVRVRERERE